MKTKKPNAGSKVRLTDEDDARGSRRDIDDALDVLRGVATVSLVRSAERIEAVRSAWNSTPRTEHQR